MTETTGFATVLADESADLVNILVVLEKSDSVFWEEAAK